MVLLVFIGPVRLYSLCHIFVCLLHLSKELRPEAVCSDVLVLALCPT